MEGDRRNTVLWVVVVAIVLAGVAAVVLYGQIRNRDRSQQVVEEPVSGRISEGVQTKSVILFFAAANGNGFVGEPREIIAGGGVGAEVGRIFRALARGPLGDGAPTVPTETRVEGAFLDDKGCLYLNLGREFRAFHWGGVTGEIVTVGSILRTLSTNFPGVRSVQFLEEGHPVETLAGHLDLTRPLWIDDWR